MDCTQSKFSEFQFNSGIVTVLVPYLLYFCIDADGRQLIRNSMKDWEKHVCVKFKARDKEKGYIQFVYKQG